MRWLGFAILAALMIVVQTSLAPWMQVGGQRPDCVFVLVVYLGLRAPRSDAMLAGGILGLLVDLYGTEPMGLFALAYGFSAVLIVRARELLLHDHPLTNLGVTFIFTLGVQGMIAVYRMLGPGAPFFGALFDALFTSIYTALLAPPLHAGLRVVNSWLGLSSSRLRRNVRV